MKKLFIYFFLASLAPVQVCSPPYFLRVPTAPNALTVTLLGFAYDYWHHKEIKKLQRACKDGDLDEVKCLLEKGYKKFINSRRWSNPFTATDYQIGWDTLRFAAFFEHVEIVKLLIKQGANLDTYGLVYGTTALIEACSRGKAEIADILLAAGANPDLQDGDGNTALHHIAKNPWHIRNSKNMIEIVLTPISVYNQDL